jgi:NADPH:quinone reductase-like Zn-dependent oxidoreductase
MDGVMRAVQIDGPGPISVLVLRWVPDPGPLGPGDVLISFLGSSINPADVKIRTGYVVPHVGSYPYVLGYDLVGEVVAVGANVDRFAEGDRVMAMSTVALTGRGTWAELVALPAASVARVPAGADVGAIARLPLVGLTALQLVRKADVRPGETVLVAGAVGSIGRHAVALLAHAGVPVHGLVRHPEQAALLLLQPGVTVGAEVEERSVDVVVDAAGGDFSAALRDGGRYVSAVPDRLPSREELAARSIDRSVIVTRESGGDLVTLASLVEAGVLALPSPHVFPLTDIHAAHEEYEHHDQRDIALVRD